MGEDAGSPLARINFLCGDVDAQFLAFLKAKEEAVFVSAAAAPAHKPSAEPAGETVLTIDDCIFEEICVNNEIDADDFDVSLLTIDDDIFEYHEWNVQRKKCARKSESRRSRTKLRERVASVCRGRQVRPGTCHRTGKVILKSTVRRLHPVRQDVLLLHRPSLVIHSSFNRQGTRSAGQNAKAHQFSATPTTRPTMQLPTTTGCARKHWDYFYNCS